MCGERNVSSSYNASSTDVVSNYGREFSHVESQCTLRVVNDGVVQVWGSEFDCGGGAHRHIYIYIYRFELITNGNRNCGALTINAFNDHGPTALLEYTV